MKARCLNKKNKDYPRYGGRGIKVCKRWLVAKNFIDDMGDRPKNKQLDRIDNNGDYEPKNCRWVTARENSNNKRNSFYISYKNETKTLSEWARHFNICPKALRHRLKSNWPLHMALTRKVNHGNRIR